MGIMIVIFVTTAMSRIGVAVSINGLWFYEYFMGKYGYSLTTLCPGLEQQVKKLRYGNVPFYETVDCPQANLSSVYAVPIIHKTEIDSN